MTDTGLIKLAERCEKATGPDREIDRDIALHFGLYDRPEDLDCFPDPAEAVVGGGGQTWAPLSYTASIDAAMTLVPEGWGYSICSTSALLTRFLSDAGVMSRAATPALALCAAALRARAALTPPSEPTEK